MIMDCMNIQYIYINREPSIYMTSILGVRIHSLVDEMVLKLSSFLLLGLAGDYDGDALGIITWDDPLLRKYVFESFNIKNSLVDTLDIKFTGTAAPHNTFGVQMYLAYGEDAVFKKIE